MHLIIASYMPVCPAVVQRFRPDNEDGSFELKTAK